MEESNPTNHDPAKGRTSRQQLKPRDDPKLLADICRLYYRGEKSHDEIVEILRRRGDQRVRNGPAVSKLIKHARQQGLVFFDIDETFALRGTELTQEGRDLSERFELDHALVIDVPDYDEIANDPLAENNKDNQSLMRADDDLHTVLANHAGLLLKNQFTAEDHVAVAGGRAVNQALRMVRRDPPSRRNIMVTSMGGRLWSHRWWASGPSSMRPLDPDDSAFILFLAFENQPGTMFEQVGHRVFAPSREQAAAVMQHNCMFQPGGKWYQNKCPKRAIVGVGAVDPGSGHRAVRNYEGSGLVQELMDRHLAKVKPELEEAIATVKDSGLYFGDVANRYFATLPLPKETNALTIDKYSQVYEKLIEQLNDLNERMVVVEWSHIRSISSVSAIAGGPFKLRALWTILFAGRQSRDQRLINTLITDAATASRLISALDTYERLDPSIQQWYENLAGTLFLDPLQPSG
jgi:DNA-binding transcriptional regulator LsrR (DeoR family)